MTDQAGRTGDGGSSRRDDYASFYASPVTSVVPTWPGTSQPPARSRRVERLLIPIVVVVSLIVALAVERDHRVGGVSLGQGDADFGEVISHPPSRTFIDPQRVLPAAAPVIGAGSYTVLRQHGGQPVRWDPCQPIHFVVRASGAPPGGRLLLDKAIDEISKDTGLFFMDDGSSTEAPSMERQPYQPDRYGKEWAPVLIAWSNPQETPELAGNVVGLGGPIAVTGKNARNVSGEVVFDAPTIAQVESSASGATFAYDIMLHELGHLVGLGHVDDPTEIMNPVSLRPLPGYGPGDLRGLAVLGEGRCFSTG